MYSNSGKINLEDIADIVGVSKATVSNALNDRKGVSEITKNKIIDTAINLGYKKINIGNTNEKKLIRIILYKRHGFVVSDTPFFINLIEGIQKECRLADCEIFISHLTRGEDNFNKIVDDIKNDKSSGYLILATEMFEDDLNLFKCLDKPTVLLDSYFKHEDMDFVLINNFDAAFKATNYLAQKGHQRIGYLHSSVYINNFHYRKEGFVSALDENDLKVNQEYWYNLEPTLEGAYNDMKILLKEKGDLPTAFFADNDIIAFGAVKALKEIGVSIPEDVSVVGFDDMPLCEISNPTITTIKVPKQYIGGLAIKRLLTKIKDEDEHNQKIEVNCELIERESVLDLR